VLKDDNLTAISKLIVLTMLNPQYLRTLWRIPWPVAGIALLYHQISSISIYFI
jgi:hypothetical protein